MSQRLANSACKQHYYDNDFYYSDRLDALQRKG